MLRGQTVESWQPTKSASSENWRRCAEGQDHLVRQLELIRRELRDDIRDLRTEVVAIRNGQLAFSAAVVAGFLGVVATLLLKV